MDEDLCKYLGPVVNKNGHRYMFLRDEETVKKLELLWMQIHQKHYLLSSRLISLGMARGFYCQEKLNCKLNWAAYAEWTSSEQLRRRQKATKQGRVVDDAFFSDDEDCDLHADDSGSTGSKTLSQLDSPLRQESYSGDRLGYEGFGGPGAVAAAIEAWKSYGGIISEEHGRTVSSLTLERKAKEEYTIADARSKGQMEFCLEKLFDALGKLDSLEALKESELQRICKSGEDVVCSNSLLDSLSQDIEGQKKVVACCETWASDGQSGYLKVQETESGVAGRVIRLEERIFQLDRHEVAVKSYISRLESGSTLFRSVPPQPILNLIAPSSSEWVELDTCVYCGLGFEPMWAVVLATCKCAYHNICCRYYFQEYTICIARKCKKEMHGDWWAAHGIVKPGTKVFKSELPKKKRPATIHEVPESPRKIQVEDDEVTEGLLWSQKSTEAPGSCTSTPTTSTIDLTSTLEVGRGSTPSPSRTPKSIRIGGSPTSMRPSLCRGVPREIPLKVLSTTALDNSVGSPTFLETESILLGSHMRSKTKGKSPGSKNCGAVTRVESEATVDPSGQESEENHDDGHDSEEQVGDEALESEGEEGREENEDSAEDEAKVDELVKRNPKKRGNSRIKRKNKANARVTAGGNSKRKKIPVEARKSIASNTRAAAKTAK